MALPAPLDLAPGISIGRLPVTGRDLFGRERELGWLDECWTGGVHVAALVAFGGVGKSALVNNWLAKMRDAGWPGAERVFGWSFYSQGTDRLSSSDEFVDAALRWFGDPAPEKGSPWDKGERLAALVREKRTILVLDGVEPLQWGPGVEEGKLKDPALQALLKELGAQNKGLCLITTRIAVADLEAVRGDKVRSKDLGQLSPEAGAALLAHRGAKGTAEELRAAASEYDGHSLALTLLGSYLADVAEGDVRRRKEIGPLEEDERQGRHARRVMAAYEPWLGKPEVAILRMLGLFDRPADKDEIAAVRDDPPIAGLTDALVGIGGRDWNKAVAKLQRVGLVSEEQDKRLDAHPLVREHFGEQLRREQPEAWREGHGRLYVYLQGKAKPRPETIEEMAPLYAAVVHGCLAGAHEEAFDEVYRKRITRGSEYFNLHKLGAFGSEVAVLSAFFEPAWERPASGLTEFSQAWVLSQASLALRAAGRPPDAARLLRLSLKMAIEQKNWNEAGRRASNLSELLQSCGELSESLTQAQKSVCFADDSDEPFQSVARRARLAAALHAMGSREEAAVRFQEAERLQMEWQPDYPQLSSVPGFRYCEFLLDGKRDAEVRGRAEALFARRLPRDSLLTIALEHITLGRAHLLAVQRGAAGDLAQAASHLAQAVDGLRRASSQEFIPLGLLARAALRTHTRAFTAARHDLDEALALAQRCGFRLHEADAHLGLARLSLAEGAPAADAHPHLAAAGAIVTATGYHRRDAELHALEEALAAKQEEKTARAQGTQGPEGSNDALALAPLAPLAVFSDPPTPLSSPTPALPPVPVPEKAGSMSTPLKLFYSYSHKDEALRDELETHLSLLKRQGTIEGWHDRKIGAGTEWAAAIDDNLEKADVVLLLISADFIASDYCYEKEMTRAIERHHAGEALVVPVALRPCDWSGALFAKLQAHPKDAKPVTTWQNRDEAWLDVAAGIRRAVDELRKRRGGAAGPSARPR